MRIILGHSLPELKEKVIVLIIWGISCRACIKEIPDLNKVKAEDTEDEVVFIAVSDDNEEDLKKFSKKYRFDYHLEGNAQAIIMNYNAAPQPKGIRYTDSTSVKQFEKKNFTVINLPQNIIINKSKKLSLLKPAR